MISQAPISFLLVASTIFALCYFHIRHQFSEHIESFDSRLKLRDDQIADYKEKLHGATPNEAKSRIEALEKAVADAAPRRLGQNKCHELSEHLKGSSGSIHWRASTFSPDSYGYMRDFLELFSSLGWKVSHGQTENPAATVGSKTGLVLFVGPGAQDEMNRVQNALLASEITFDRFDERDEREPSVMPNRESGLLVTSRRP